MAAGREVMENLFLTLSPHDGKKVGECMSEARNTSPELRVQRLAIEQLALALRNLRPHPLLMPIFAFAICCIYARSVPLHVVEIWYVSFTLSLVPFAVVLHRFFARERSAAETRTWSMLATATYSLSTLAWATQPIFLWAPGNDLNHLLMILFLAGYLSGQAPFTAPCKPLAASIFVIDGAALVAAPWRGGGFIYELLSLITLFYTVYTLYMTRQMHISATNALTLKHEKTDLVVALADSKNESDQARYRAEAASRSKSQFLANMSHELRTPLNAILGFSEVIASGVFAKQPERHSEYANLIHSSGRHLLALINDILDLAKIEAGTFTLRDTEVDLRTIIDDEMERAADQASAAGVKLEASISPSTPLVSADERALRQIVQGLMSNAIRFTPREGRVTVFAEPAEGYALSFGVADTGAGIADDEQTRIFENFGQGRHDVATADHGVGLGLAIVKGLAEAHGGSVSLESALGKGTRVSVFLPSVRKRPRAETKAASGSSILQGRLLRSDQSQVGTVRCSRSRPPSTAAKDAIAAPRSKAAPTMNACNTAATRARCSASVDSPIARLTRSAASASLIWALLLTTAAR